MSNDGPSRWRVARAARVHENPHFRVMRADVRRPDGSSVDYFTLDFPRPAVAVVLRRGDAVLLVRQQRFIVARDVWALPSGGVEPGEALVDAALRELVEETGHRAGRIAHLLSYYPSYGVGNQVFHCFSAEDPDRVHDPDPNEVDRVAWFSDAELRAMIARGEVPDGFSLTPLLYVAAGLAPQPLDEAARCKRVSLDDGGDEGRIER